MNTKNLFAILAGLVVSMLLGFLVYGMLLQDTMNTSIMAGLMKSQEEFVWWAMIASNLCMMILLTMLFHRMGIRDFKSGFMAAFWISVLIVLYFDLFFWAASNMYTNSQIIVIDIIAAGITNGIVGGVIGWMLGRGKPATATA